MLPIRRLAALSASLVTVAGPALAASEHAVLPGWWEYTASTALSAPKTDRRCVKPSEIDSFVAGPSNRHYRCTYPVSELSGGKARFEGVCVSKHGSRYPVRWAGDYGPEHFELHGTASPSLAGLAIPVSATIEARRLSATCPAG